MSENRETGIIYHSIVLAYDGSQEGRKALCEGAELARTCRAQAHLLAVMRLPLGLAIGETFSSEAMIRDAYEQAETILQEGIAELKEHGVNAAGYLRQGDAVAEISNLANEMNADLIVVGHRHRDGVARWWHSPTGATLLDAVPCSVLIACSVSCDKNSTD